MGNYQGFKRIIILSIAFIFGLFIAVAQANTSDFPFYWDFMNVDIEVESNGDMLVTETKKYVFNSNHTNERYRYIPLNKVDDIKDVTVEENGKKISSTTGKKKKSILDPMASPIKFARKLYLCFEVSCYRWITP